MEINTHPVGSVVLLDYDEIGKMAIPLAIQVIIISNMS